jgi:hypothetical protein
MSLSLTIVGFVHVTLSLLALACGLVLVMGLIAGRQTDALAAVYFASAAVAVATGFVIGTGFGVPQLLGVAAAIELTIAIVARYALRLAAIWRPIFAVATVASVHLFVFFTIGEAFLRFAALKTLAPTLTELPFALAQLAGIVLFAALAIAAAARFRNTPVAAD